MPADGTGTDAADLVDVMAERRRLLSMAYRMTGTLAEAEDVVQETYLRWYRLSDDERTAVLNPAGWFTRVAGRVALDMLGSARTRRERYIGQWLPEPVPADLFAGTALAPASGSSVTAPAGLDDPADRVTLDDSVSTALLVVLEAMTPAERVAFVLHDVFAVPFADIAETVGRSPAAARQLATSARRRVQAHRASAVPPTEHDATVRAFLAATRSGDLRALTRVLAPGVELRSDGGGVVRAAPNVVRGADNVGRFILGLLSKQPALAFTEQRTADGLAFRISIGDAFFGVVGFRVTAGQVVDVWIVLNPGKLTSWTAHG